MNGKKEPDGREVYRSPGATVVWWVWVLFAIGNLVDIAVQGHGHLSLVAVFILLFVTGMVYVAAKRPRLVADDDGLTITNPFRGHRVGWAAVAGYDPGKIIKRHVGRITMLHIKDFLKIEKGMRAGGPNSPLGAEIGTGVVDYKKIFAEIQGCPIQHIFVEQEGPYTRFTQMQAAEADYRYLHSLS